MLFSYICTNDTTCRAIEGIFTQKRGLRTMLQDAVEGVPQRGTLLRRAHELLEGIGQPTAESLLIQHLFGLFALNLPVVE